VALNVRTVKYVSRWQAGNSDEEMKYRLGSLTIEAVDTFVRVSVANIGGLDAPVRVAVTNRQCPKPEEVAQLVKDIRGYWPDASVLSACSRAAEDARNNKTELDL
jgi:hypothetical protein